MRRLPLAVCCLVAPGAPGAPVPSPMGKGGFEAPEWKRADPRKDCKFVFGDGGDQSPSGCPARPRAGC
jgi:hypothetical protein